MFQSSEATALPEDEYELEELLKEMGYRQYGLILLGYHWYLLRHILRGFTRQMQMQILREDFMAGLCWRLLCSTSTYFLLPMLFYSLIRATSNGFPGCPSLMSVYGTLIQPTIFIAMLITD